MTNEYKVEIRETSDGQTHFILLKNGNQADHTQFTTALIVGQEKELARRFAVTCKDGIKMGRY